MDSPLPSILKQQTPLDSPSQARKAEHAHKHVQMSPLPDVDGTKGSTTERAEEPGTPRNRVARSVSTKTSRRSSVQTARSSEAEAQARKGSSGTVVFLEEGAEPVPYMQLFRFATPLVCIQQGDKGMKFMSGRTSCC